MAGGELDLVQILLASGFVVKAVLLILILCSVYSWAVIFNKHKELKQLKSDSDSFTKSFSESEGLSFTEIKEKTQDFNSSPLFKMLEEGINELNSMKALFSPTDGDSSFKDYFKAHGVQALDRSLNKGAGNASLIMENRLPALASIGSITPFIGLFGTVWGIIDSFTGLATGGGSIEAVAPGIAEALVATAVGLAAAIPAVWGYNFFNTKIGIIQSQMENFGQDFINRVERQMWQAKGQ